MNNRTSGGNVGLVGTETAGLYTYQKMNLTMTIGYYRPPSAPTSPVFTTPAKDCVTATPVAYTGVLDATQLSDITAVGYPWDQN